MTEWFVRYVTFDDKDCLVVLPSFWKLLIWFVCTAWRCMDIKIFIG